MWTVEMRRNGRRAAICLAAWLALAALGCRSSDSSPATAPRSEVQSAYTRHLSGVEVEAAGRVERVLSDDRTGVRHERFVLAIDSGPTVLIVHNLDIAERVPVHAGDEVTLRGEYVWNDKGGLIHWTHRDPSHRHKDGWIRYRGTVYQ